MSLEKYLNKLKTRHREIDDEIKNEMTHRLPNFSLINGLKKKKLKIKDMMEKVAFKAGALSVRDTATT